MYSISGNEIFARARTLATQTGIDSNQSNVIDSLPNLRTTLNHAIREVYRRKSNDQKFSQDITTRHTVAIGTGEGTCEPEIMREFLHQANITDENDSLVTYFNYQIDTNQTFDTLGYLWLEGDTFHYRAPSPDLDDFDGDLYVTVQSFPEFPASMASDIEFPSQATAEDVILFLAQAILGKEGYQVVTV